VRERGEGKGKGQLRERKGKVERKALPKQKFITTPLPELATTD